MSITPRVLQDQPQGYILSYFYEPLRILSLPFVFIFLENLYIPPWLVKTFKFMVFILLKNAFVSKKIEFTHCYSCSLRQKSLPGSSPGRCESFIPPGISFSKILFPPAERGTKKLWLVVTFSVN